MTDLSTRLDLVRHNLLQSIKVASEEFGIDPRQEARRLANLYNIEAKAHDPEEFVELALHLLVYPPPLAFAIANQFSDLTAQLGFSPFATLMVTIGHIDHLFAGVAFRVSHLRAFGPPPYLEVVESKNLRLQRAGTVMAIALLLIGRTIPQIRDNYQKQDFQTPLKEIIDAELAKIDPEIACAVYV